MKQNNRKYKDIYDAVRKKPLLFLAVFLLLFFLLLQKLGYQTVIVPSFPEGEILEIRGSLWKQEIAEKTRIYLNHLTVRASDHQISHPDDSSEFSNQTIIQDKNNNTEHKAADTWVSLDPEISLIISTSSAEYFPIGTAIEASGIFYSFEEAANPGNFSMREYYEAQNIYGTLAKAEVTDTRDHTDLLKEMIRRIRTWVRNKICENIPKEEQGILCAILLGDKTEMDAETKEIFQIGGLSAVLVVSGLHVSFFGMTIHRWMRRRFSRGVSGITAFLVVLFYVLFTGASSSAIRAAIMFAYMLTADFLGRKNHMEIGLSAALILMLLSQPKYILQSGFRLSILAIAGIAFFAPHLKRKGGKKISEAFSVTLGVQLATLPVLVYGYSGISIAGLFTNLPANELLSFIMGAGLLAIFFLSLPVSIPFLSSVVCILLDKLTVLLQWIADAGAAMPSGWWLTGRPFLWQYVGYGIFLAFGLFPEGNSKKKRILCWSMAALLLLLPPEAVNRGRIPANGCSITAVDVGQGDCFLLRFADGTNCLIDCGSSSVKQVAKYRVTSFLQAEGVRRLDYIFLSHMDDDHINGILEWLSGYQTNILGRHRKEQNIGTIVVTERVDEQTESFRSIQSFCAQHRIGIRKIGEGDRLVLGNASLLCCYPGEKNISGDENENSMVLLLKQGSFRMLFTGDLGIEGEKSLLLGPFREEIADISVLKVGHHGSKGSSGEEFLDWIDPKAALISCGKNNSYGHPNPETLDRLKERKIAVFRTDQLGPIRILVSGETYQVQLLKNTDSS